MQSQLDKEIKIYTPQVRTLQARAKLRQDLKSSRSRLEKLGLETSLTIETKSRDSITDIEFLFPNTTCYIAF